MPSHKVLLYEQQAGKCFYCADDIDLTKATIDHIKPTIHGGDNKLTNKVIACQPCNNMKGNLGLALFIEQCRKISARAMLDLI